MMRHLLLLLTATIAASAAEPATWCRFVPERLDDFAWENDLIAFRAYGPALRGKAESSGVDCWLKRVPYPIIDGWYAGDKKGKSYHKDTGEGYDPYHTGSSRGCGGTALWIDGQMVHAGPYTEWKILERTTQRSSFVLTYSYPAAAGAAPIIERKQITIALGERLFRSESSFTREGKPLPALPVAVGITTHDGAGTAMLDPQGRWLGVWEVIDTQGLGTGVVLDRAATLSNLKTTTKDGSHALAVTTTDDQGRLTFRAGYGWQKAGAITTKDAWQDFLTKAASP